MLPRSMRTGGDDLPGAESNSVPLIGYRSLQPDCETRSSHPGSLSDQLETSHVSVVFPFSPAVLAHCFQTKSDDGVATDTTEGRSGGN